MQQGRRKLVRHDASNTVWFDRSDEGASPPSCRVRRTSRSRPWSASSTSWAHAKQFHDNPTWYRSTATVLDEMGVPYQIEYDNMHKHEDPLLREMGLPIRQRYEFFVSESEAKKRIAAA